MSKPNFFADLDVLNCLLGMQYDVKAKPAMDLTIDFQDLPLWFSLKSDRKAQTLTIYKQMELYTKDEKMAMLTASVTLDNATGQAQVKAPQGLGDNMAAFYIASRNLSLFAKEKGLENLWRSSNPEQSGILLSAKGKTLTWKLVSGGDRPELTVERMFGGTIKMRPYMDDFWDRSETEMMSLEERIKKAEGGDKFAIAKLATAYLNGDDEVEADPEKAAYWFRKEADLQDSEGAFNLGLLYAKGYGVKRDFAQAAEWMEKAVARGDKDGEAPAKQYRALAENLKKAEAGDADAMFELAGGYMMLGGSLDQAGPGQDYAESMKWAQKAVNAGNAAGYWTLALAYEHGRGVKKDDKKALELYKKGAELGNDRCQHSYGCRLINGEGVKKDAKQALALFEKSAEQGYTLAYKALGHMYETGEGVEPDFDKELEYFEKACQADPSDAEFLRHVGFQYTNLMEDKEKWLHGVERAAYWLREAANRGDRTAAGGANMYERILELHKQGVIPAGTDMGECMGYLSGDGGEKAGSGQQNKDVEKARKEREAAEAKKKEAEREAKKKEAEQRAKKEAETIRETVRRAREEAKSAERTFDRRAAEIERKTSGSLDFYSADFEPRLREIASLSAEACRSLYNAYQEQVRKVDRICRPLVNSSRRHGEIKEIADVIKWLNEESKIENNFSATLNNFNMGNLVQARYSPSGDCMAIQRFWEDTLKKTQKTPEEIREEQAEKERRAKEEKERRERERREAEERRPTPKQIENRGFKDDIVSFMEPDTLYTAQNIAESVPSVVAAGLSVNRVMAMLTQLVNDGSLIRTEDKQKTYFSLASQNEKQQRPQPSAPAATVRQPTPKQVSYTGFKADILAWMKPDTLYTAQDIAKGVPSVVAAGFSVDRVMPYLTQLSDDGALEKTDDGAKRYYSLPGTEAKRSAREKAKREEKEREAAAALRTVLAHRQEEERRKAEEARRQEEERRKAEEARRQEEERRKAEEEARRQEEERRRAEEEARKAEEAHRRAEEAAAARQKTAETAYSGTEAHTEKGKSGVNKTVLILAVALTLVTGILIGVLVSHAAGGKRGGENPAVLMPQTNAGESLDIDNGEATVESIESQGQAGVSLPNKENRLDTVIVDENNMRPIFIDDKAIKVSLNSFSYANNETVYGLNILLENRSDKTVSVVLTDVEIDSFEISTSQGKMAVSPGHSAICDSAVWQKNIDEAGIQDWSELAGTILVREDYFGEPIYSVPVIIKRSCWEYEKTFHDTSFKPVAPTKAEAPDGAVVLSSKNTTPILLEQDGVRLSINSFSTSNSGTVFKINFLLENGTDEDMSVVLTDVVINGYEISTSQGKMMVSAGKKAVCDSSIWEKNLKLAHIEEWTELQGTILVRKDYFGEELFSIPVIIYKDVW